MEYSDEESSPSISLIPANNETKDLPTDSWDSLMFKIENEPIEIKKLNFVTKFESEEKKESRNLPSNICETCFVPFSVDSDGTSFCTKCGIEIKDKSGSVSDTDAKPTFMQMKISDGNSRNRHQKSLFRSTANYEQYQIKDTLDKFIKACSQGINGKFIPKSILVEANKVFQKIRSVVDQVFRKDVKLGIMSACVSYVMMKNNVSRPPTEISQQFKIEHKFHSRGDTLVQKMISRGVLEHYTESDPIVDYIKMYLELLKINAKYCDFVREIIEKAEEKMLHVLFDSKNNTKCIGTIWFLVERLKLPISKDHIAKVCEISKTTFIKYYTIICSYYKFFIPIFEKHAIPLKTEWKAEIYAYYGQSMTEQKKPLVGITKVSVPIVKKTTRKKNIVMNLGLKSPTLLTPLQTPRQTPISIISGMSRRSSISSTASAETTSQVFDFKPKKVYKRRVAKKIVIDNPEELDPLNDKIPQNSIFIGTHTSMPSHATTLSPDSPGLH